MTKRLDKEEVIRRIRAVHGDKYDYSKVEYKGRKEKVAIICPIHGVFHQTIEGHLSGYGCPKCANNHKYTVEEFKEISKEKHNNYYDYSLVTSLNRDTDGNVEIICPVHGVFKQHFRSHMKGQGCPKCAHEYVNSLKVQGFEGFKKKVEEKYGDRFILNESTYVDSSTKMEIICREHGPFMITPNNFLRGHKCPRCNDSKLETEISTLLKKNEIEFIQNANKSTFEWLGWQHIDFYLPKYNVAIECQGGQHFTAFERFGGKDGLKKRIQLDKNKKQLCEENKIKLLYYNNIKKYDSFLGEKVYHDKTELVNEIKSNV